MDRLVRRFFWISLVLSLAWCPPVFSADSRSTEEFGGVGLQVVPTITGHLSVLQVMPGSPAAAGSLRPGDLIFQVDDFPLEGSEFAEVISNHLWGPIDSRVTLHYLRPGVAGPHSVTLQRAAMTPKITVSPAVRESQQEQGRGGPVD